MERALMDPRKAAGLPAETESPPADARPAPAPTSLLRPLVEDLQARRAKIRLAVARRRSHSSTSARSSPRASASRCSSTTAASSSSASTAGRTSPSGRWTASTRPRTA
jgi:hypothetical protein